MQQTLIGWIFLLLTASLASAFPTQPRSYERDYGRHQSLPGQTLARLQERPASVEDGVVKGWIHNVSSFQGRRDSFTDSLVGAGCDQGSWIAIAPCGGGQICVSDGTDARCALHGQTVQLALNPAAPGLAAAPAAPAPTTTSAPTAAVPLDLAVATASLTEGMAGAHIPGAPVAQDVRVDNTTGSASSNGDKSESETISAENGASEPPSNHDTTSKENPSKNYAEGGSPVVPATSETEVQESKPESPTKGGANSGPHYVIYTDSENSLTKEKGKMLPSVADLKGFNRLILAFWMTDRKLPARPELTGKAG